VLVKSVYERRLPNVRFPPKADIDLTHREVRFVPKADIAASFVNRVSAAEQ
jgi:hypothetical protein